MLGTTRERLLAAIAPDDVVLDIGGWADPFERADWVLDLMPYESRGLYVREGWAPPRSAQEQFSEQTWIQRDICDHERYPFGDDEIDFVICSQTLEDVRDPVWVCREINRIGKAGYIEVPSRLEEQSWGVNGPFAGWSHHRWLVDVSDGGLQFVMKLHSIHSREEHHFPAGFWESLAPEERIEELWWQGGFGYRERVFTSGEESDRYLSEFVATELARRNPARGGWRRRLSGRSGP